MWSCIRAPAIARYPFTPEENLSDSLELKNHDAAVRLMRRGAEPVRWTIAGRDLLWRGDPSVWAATSPILFPVVGWTRGGVIRVAGETFPMSVHGFAADSLFAVAEAGARHAVLICRDTEETRRRFPFAFALAVRYDLAPTHLAATFTVRNTGDRPLPYALGFHPGFAWPFAGGGREGYAIVFAQAERAFVPRITREGLFAPDERPIPLDGGRLPLSDALFASEALCFLRARSRSLRFLAPDGAAVEVTLDDFPHVALWSRPGAPFVCIEAWTGHGDPEGFEGDIGEKPSMRFLAPGESARHAVRLAFHETN